ncbi:nucleotidyltransferase family protein [Crocosphaera sp.]|uniref:nucleotidyltransferase family protein n=1 Tax=Crocosphaera sp. TaxID=2729996 RepID=UPI002603901E|nr:nucleotidyltransferase family protein [Crocosphaera sp.]MDJ0581297.1 nucleotidyltransferase family protein [Crocosphaera sp.]
MNKLLPSKLFLFRENHFINPSICLLLSVIFAEDMEAKLAWQSLRNEVEKDSLSSANYKVFSLLISRLCQLEIEDELIPKLKGVARYSWVKNQIKVQVIATLIEQLQKNQIPFTLLNNIGLLLFLYQDSIKLNVSNIALLVAPDDVLKTIDMLEKEGWKPKGFICEALLEEFSFTRLENENVSQDIKIIELFWKMESKNSYHIISSEYIFKQELEVIEFNNHQVSVLNATYQLYYLLSILGDDVNVASWSVNFVNLLKNNHYLIDWNKISYLLKANNIHLILKKHKIIKMLNFLEQFHQNKKLDKTIDEILITPSDKFEFWLRKYKKINPFFQRLNYRYERYTRTDIYKKNNLSKLRGFFIYLKREWRLNSYWELPQQILTRSSKYLRKFVKG